MKKAINTPTFAAVLVLALSFYPVRAMAKHAVMSVDHATSGARLCSVTCVSPLTSGEESQKVIDTLQILVKALNTGDLTTYADYLADGCTTFEESNNHLVVGKEQVMGRLRAKLNQSEKDGEAQLVSYTIDHPYALVNGDIAVVSFRAVRETSGKHPTTEVCKATDVFVKDGDKWKKLHYRAAHWHRIG